MLSKLFGKSKNVENKEQKTVKQPDYVYFEMAQGFDKSRNHEAEKSKKIAWKVAGGFGLIAAALSFALVLLVPLKTVVPYVIRVDNNTGATDIVYQLKDAKSHYGEALDKYWLAKYVVNRESYDWETIQLTYDTVKLMSSPQAFNDYAEDFKKKDSLLKIYENKKKVVAKVISISFFDDVAQVRFEKTTLPTTGIPTGTDGKPKKWIATIPYEYINKSSNEAERLVNPLGFKAVSYRRDPENIEAQ